MYGFRQFSCALLVSVFSLVFLVLLFILSFAVYLFNRVYLSSMLFRACSSVTIAIGIINAYMLVLCLYMRICIVCAAGDQARRCTSCLLCLCLYGLYIRLIYVETIFFWPVIGFVVWPV